MTRSLLAASLAFAGVLVLAGAGWALLAGAFLVFALWPQGAETAFAGTSRKAVTVARRLAGRVRAAPRRAAALGGMGGGLALLPAGLGLSAGAGVALTAAAAALIGVSVLTGWGA